MDAIQSKFLLGGTIAHKNVRVHVCVCVCETSEATMQLQSATSIPEQRGK